MSRVHDALRKAAEEKAAALPPPPSRPTPTVRAKALADEPARPVDQPFAPGQPSSQEQPFSGSPASAGFAPSDLPDPAAPDQPSASVVLADAALDIERLEEFIQRVPVVPFTPAADALLVNPAKPKDAPAEEFRSLRTRLNHLQRSQPLHTLVVTSASPGEGKSFTACNLAMSQAQLSGKRILLADFDFRRPSIDKIFGVPPVPGITDFLLGKARIHDLIRRVEGTNLFIITAGESVPNPLELLNLPQCGTLIEALRDHFDWVILDSPPLLFAADGNLLSTMADGTVLVVRIGATTYDSVARAVQSLCENNVLGIVVNGAHRGELYSRYSYYHNYYYEPDNRITAGGSGPDGVVEVEPIPTGKS